MRTAGAKFERDFPRRDGEVPLKFFVAELGRRMGIGWHGAYYQFKKLRGLKIRRVNKRVVFIETPLPGPLPAGAERGKGFHEA